jgi:hypothetical protein
MWTWRRRRGGGEKAMKNAQLGQVVHAKSSSSSCKDGQRTATGGPNRRDHCKWTLFVLVVVKAKEGRKREYA